MHIARVGERLPRLQIQFRISRSFRPRNLANLGSKIRFWIRRKEHTLNVDLGLIIFDLRLIVLNMCESQDAQQLLSRQITGL